MAESAILDSHCFLKEKRFNKPWNKPEKHTLTPHTKFELNKYVPKHRGGPVNMAYFCVFMLGEVSPVQVLVIQTLVSMSLPGRKNFQLHVHTRTHVHTSSECCFTLWGQLNKQKLYIWHRQNKLRRFGGFMDPKQTYRDLSVPCLQPDTPCVSFSPSVSSLSHSGLSFFLVQTSQCWNSVGHEHGVYM